MERTISSMMGKGSVNHNTRAFSAKNVDKERSRDNVEFCHSDIKEVYHNLLMKHWNATTQNRNGVTERLTITMRRYAGEIRKNYFMRSFFKSATRMI